MKFFYSLIKTDDISSLLTIFAVFDLKPINNPFNIDSVSKKRTIFLDFPPGSEH